jgi:hypothetical protein
VKTFLEILQEATFKWNLDPNDRAWFISIDGKILSGTKHEEIIKKKFSEDWRYCLEHDKISNPSVILESRMMEGGYTKFAEFNDFIVIIVWRLNKQNKDIIQGFCKSWLDSQRDPNKPVNIQTFWTDYIIKSSVKEISKDYLYSLKENRRQYPQRPPKLNELNTN